MLGPRGQELAGGAAHQAGTLPPVTANAGRPFRLQLTDAHFTGVGPRLEALPRLILPTLVFTVRASRAAVTGPLAGLGTGGDALDAGAGDDSLVTHAGGAGAVGGLPATAFRVLLPANQAASAAGTAAPLLCHLERAGQGRAWQPCTADLAGLTATPLTAAWGPLKRLPVLVLPAVREAAVANGAEAGAWRGMRAESWGTRLLPAAHGTFLAGAEGAGGVKWVRKGLSGGSSDPMIEASLAGWATVPRQGEWMAAAQRLTGPAATGHEAPKAGAPTAGLSGIWELLAAQVGLSQVLTAITGRTAVTPSREGALCRGTDPGLAADTTLPAETDVAPGSGRREALPAGELLPLVLAAIAGGAAGPLAWVGAGHRWAGQPLAGHRAIQAEAEVAGVVGWGEVLLVVGRDLAPGPRAAGRGGRALWAALSWQHGWLWTQQGRAAAGQALHIATQTATQAAGVRGVGEVCSIGVLLPTKGTAIAVVLATGTRQRVGTGGRGADPRLTVGLAFLTLAFLAGVSGVGEALPIHKHLFLQDTVWAPGAALAGSSLGPGTGCGRAVDQGARDGPILAAARVARTICICEVLPIGIYLAMVGAALTAGAAGAKGPGRVLAGGWGAEQSPAHGHPSLTGAGHAGLTIRLPLDPLGKLLAIKHAGWAELRARVRQGTGGHWALPLLTGDLAGLTGAVDTSATLLESEGLLALILVSLVLTAITDWAALPRDPAWVSAGRGWAGQRLTLDTPVGTTAVRAGVPRAHGLPAAVLLPV